MFRPGELTFSPGGCHTWRETRAFRKVVAAAGLNPQEWTPRELRHSFVSLLSDADVPIERTEHVQRKRHAFIRTAQTFE